MATASLSSPPAAVATAANVFEWGKFHPEIDSVDSAGRCFGGGGGGIAPPKPLLIGRPAEGGEFPVMVLNHGYLLYNCFYSELIKQVVSHGFIVVAPQYYTMACMDSSPEVKAISGIVEWLPEGLQQHLPAHVHPNLNKLAIAGHSRGGKTAFAFALGLKESAITKAPKLSALIGLDPVDGTNPRVLDQGTFDFGFALPVMVIGSGLGDVKRNCMFPACAPKEINHEEFFKKCGKPTHYMVVKDYGHMDMLDDKTCGIRGMGCNCMCKNGESRGPMRTFLGGAVVAFLKAYLEGKEGDLKAIEDGSLNLPVELQTLEVRV